MPKVRKCSKQTKIKTNPTMIKVFKGTQKRSESSQWPKLKPFEQQNKGELGYHPKYKISIHNFLMDQVND